MTHFVYYFKEKGMRRLVFTGRVILAEPFEVLKFNRVQRNGLLSEPFRLPSSAIDRTVRNGYR